ncbi:hypothetical protein SEA_WAMBURGRXPRESS_58 [Mycobacterium phage Wamburgrxpress]|uniref:Uncharacterized protein n=1 Tax=Mycobacterium phage Wamburgrxpress TaxID=2315617 RepID=A0A386KB02_9CAUD|nr:hypothetical protein SEA_WAMBURGRXPRESS_58 [Mycobacterium phage Wamburgrxpress]
MNSTCAVDGCANARYGRKEYCQLHYQRARRGKPLDTTPRNSIFYPVTLRRAHDRIARLWGPASAHPCVDCAKPAKDWAYDGTDPDQLLGKPASKVTSGSWYSIFPEFYMPLCRSCHVKRDRVSVAAELYEYRKWRAETRLTLADFGGAAVSD